MVGLTILHILTKNHINWCKGVEMVAVKQNPAQLTPVSPINTEDTSRVDSASRQERIAARTRGVSARVSLIDLN